MGATGILSGFPSLIAVSILSCAAQPTASASLLSCCSGYLIAFDTRRAAALRARRPPAGAGFDRGAWN
jgi:hypothetical protein